MHSKSSQNFDPQRHYGLTDDVYTMPGAWDLSSMPASPENDAGIVYEEPKIPYAIQAAEQPRLLWLMDPYYEWGMARCYPYFAPF